MRFLKYKKFIENGEYSNKLDKLSEGYSRQERESISHFDILIRSSRANTIYKNNVPYKCVVDYGRLPKKSALSNADLEFFREVMTRPEDDIKAGDIVEFAPNSYEQRETYLLLKTIETRDGYNLSIMRDCNETLRWVDENGVVHSYPCVYYYGTKGNFGTYSDKIMTIPDNRRQVIVQKNEHTVKFRTDKRFILGGTAYEVIDFDISSDKGLVNLNLKGTVIGPSDNLELGIADYYNHTVNYEIKILNGSRLSIELTQLAKVTTEVRKNGVLVENPPLQYFSDNDSVVSVDSNGYIQAFQEGTATITVCSFNACSSIEVNVTNYISNNYTAEILGSEVVSPNSTKVYDAIFKNNGIPFADSSYFYITSDDGVSNSNIATIIAQNSQENKCTIKIGQKTGWFILHVENINKLAKTSMNIQVKSLI